MAGLIKKRQVELWDKGFIIKHFKKDSRRRVLPIFDFLYRNFSFWLSNYTQNVSYQPSLRLLLAP